MKCHLHYKITQSVQGCSNHSYDFTLCHRAMNLIPHLCLPLLFPVFYGMMFADVGYAIVILLVSRWVIWRVEGGHRNFTIMPKSLRKFGKTILQPVQMIKIAKALTLGCTVAIILGFCFNLYFGFHLNQYLFDWLNSIGGFHLPENGTIF